VLHLFDQLDERRPTLAEALGARGFRTSGVISHFLINAKQGYARGFERYLEEAVAGHAKVSSPKVTNLAIHELRRLKEERFFLFVHFFDPHTVYLHHEEFDRTSDYRGPAREWNLDILNLRANRDRLDADDLAFLRGLYREEIAYTDKHVGLLLDELANLGLKKKTLVILTADHGEEFMEHDWIGHTRFLYDTLLHVPLVFSLPGTLEPRGVAAPVSLVDVMPTLLALSETGPRGYAADGEPLGRLLKDGMEDVERKLFAEVSFLAPPDERGTPAAEKQSFQTAVSQGHWKLIHDLEQESWSLFDRAADPTETHDLFDRDHPQVRSLQPLLREWEQGKVDTWGLDREGIERMSAEDRERLRSLGYVR
jgi:arylsulfatase A-like enzyme